MPQASNDTDLTTCESEPIRTPGSIQPHGFLLALSPRLEVLQVSDNLAQFTGIAPESALGRPLTDVIGAAGAQALEPNLRGGQLRERPAYIATVGLEGESFDVLAHAYDELLVLEFERSRSTVGVGMQQLYPLVGDFLNKISDADTIAELCQLAASEISALTGFGRVLVYSFDDEGHGNVLAECVDDGYDSYLGQRFPASDIPRQARELYLANRIRLIQDADYQPARLVPPENPLTGKPNDLSFASLRSVSPIHLQYMRNMGTMASMSVSYTHLTLPTKRIV